MKRPPVPLHYTLRGQKRMQHDQVIEKNLVERYLLGEMSAGERDSFEEHYFECRECAHDVRATAAFLDIARNELAAAAPVTAASAIPVRHEESPAKRWWASLWSPAFGYAMAAACLAVVMFQNLVTFPALTTQVARLESPGVQPNLSLAGSVNRAGELRSAPLAPSLTVSFDIPGRPEFTGYTCNFISSTGKLLTSVPVSSAEATDTVSVHIPAASWGPGQYTIEVQGASATGGAPVALTRYTFALTAGPTTSVH